MPDMRKPGAHFESLLETVRYKKLELRRDANKLLTQAEVYEFMEYEIRDAIDKEVGKSPTVSALPVTGEQQK